MLQLNELSKIGFGTYRTDINNPSHIQALKTALNHGCNLIDTAPNYRNGNSELMIGKILSKTKSTPFIMTKAGYVEGENLKNVRNWNSNRTIKIDNTFGYSLDVNFFRYQLSNSLKRLGKKHVDAFLIHNPEHIFSLKEIPFTKENIYSYIKELFEFLEEEVKKGTIRYYGISSNTLPLNASEDTTLSISRLVEIADGVDENNNFKLLQFPYNVLEDDASDSEHEKKKTLLNLSKEYGFTTFSNRPLNVQSENGAIRLAITNSYAIDEQKAAENFELFFEQVFGRLKEIGMENEWEQFPILVHLKKNWKLSGNPEAVIALFSGHLNPFINSLFEGKPPKSFLTSLELLKKDMVEYAKKKMDDEAKKIEASMMKKGLISENNQPLPFKVCRYYLDKGIDHILVGMRSPEYVNQLSGLF